MKTRELKTASNERFFYKREKAIVLPPKQIKTKYIQFAKIKGIIVLFSYILSDRMWLKEDEWSLW